MFESLINLFKQFTGGQKVETTESTEVSQQSEAQVPVSNPGNTAPAVSEPQPVSQPVAKATVQYNTLGKFNLGSGSIGPANRTDIDQETLNEMYQAVAAGVFNVPANGAVPEICVDGRTDKDGKRLSAPCAAGGTLSIVYGGDLGGALAANDVNELQLTAQTVNILKGKGHSTGVHGDDHGSCGCGACAKARAVYQYVTEHINDIAALTSQYGIDITDSEKADICLHAQKRLDQADFFAEDRAAVLQVARDNGAGYEELVGVHNELGVALNTKAGTTIDRTAIRARFGPQYDMFVVDAWAFGTAASDINQTGDDQSVQHIVKAITVQNVATASVLGHGSLSVIPIA